MLKEMDKERLPKVIMVRGLPGKRKRGSHNKNFKERIETTNEWKQHKADEPAFRQKTLGRGWGGNKEICSG